MDRIKDSLPAPAIPFTDAVCNQDKVGSRELIRVEEPGFDMRRRDVIDSGYFVEENTAVYVLLSIFRLQVCRALIGPVEGMRLVSLRKWKRVSNDLFNEQGFN